MISNRSPGKFKLLIRYHSLTIARQVICLIKVLWRRSYKTTFAFLQLPSNWIRLLKGKRCSMAASAPTLSTSASPYWNLIVRRAVASRNYSRKRRLMSRPIVKDAKRMAWGILSSTASLSYQKRWWSTLNLAMRAQFPHTFAWKSSSTIWIMFLRRIIRSSLWETSFSKTKVVHPLPGYLLQFRNKFQKLRMKKFPIATHNP